MARDPFAFAQVVGRDDPRETTMNGCRSDH